MIKTSISDCKYRTLAEAARAAFENAYCPYSDYKVGAAVLTEDGKIYTGCNMENASYGASNCAERTAVFKAVSEGARVINAIAVASGEEGSAPPFPCGICRQVLSEFSPREDGVLIMDVIVVQSDDEVYNFALDELLPYSFRLDGQ